MNLKEIRYTETNEPLLVCKECMEWKPVNDYYGHSHRSMNNRYGKMILCKKCFIRYNNEKTKERKIKIEKNSPEWIEINTLFERMGYDTSDTERTIYQQFLDRHPELKK